MTNDFSSFPFQISTKMSDLSVIQGYTTGYVNIESLKLRIF